MAFEEAPTAKQMNLYAGIGGNDQGMTKADFTGQSANAKTWKLLKMKHSQYDQDNIDHKKQKLLYQGGFQMNEPDVAKLFCPKLKNEDDDQAFKERIASAAYVPTFSKLTTGLISNLFSEDLAVMEAADNNDPSTAGEEFTSVMRDHYKLIESNCDGFGTSLHDFARELTTKALVHTKTFFGIDYPKGEAANLLEQEKRGLDRARFYKVDFESVWDYKLQEGSCTDFEWIKLGSCIKVQETPFDEPKHKYVILALSVADEVVSFEMYETPPVVDDKELLDKQLIPLVDTGTTSFKTIPIVMFLLNDGVAVGARLAPMAAEHFNRRTIENHCTNRACITVPVVYRGAMFPGGDSLPDPVQGDTRRGDRPSARVNNKGVVEMGDKNTDLFEIVEAKGTALSFIHDQNKDLDEEMHSVIHQMGQSLKQASSKSGKSAASKQEDRRSTEMLLSALADEVYCVIRKAFKIISLSRNEDIVWEVKGLSTVQPEERSDLVLEAQALQLLNFPSITQQKEHFYRVGSRLIEGASEEVMRTMRGELEENLEKAWEMKGDAAIHPGAVDPSSMESAQLNAQKDQSMSKQEK